MECFRDLISHNGVDHQRYYDSQDNGVPGFMAVLWLIFFYQCTRDEEKYHQKRETHPEINVRFIFSTFLAQQMLGRCCRTDKNVVFNHSFIY